MAKIFELLLSNQVTSHYDETLYYRMTAYRKRHSCKTTLLRLTEDWKEAIHNKQLVSVLSTDISKPFDSLSHSLMIKKLEANGFRGRSLNLMQSLNLMRGGDHETVGSRMKIHGQQALLWYTNNFLLANPDKFQSLNINLWKLDKDKGDNINDLDIVNTELIKLLGVRIDDNLNFIEHISKLHTKTSQKVRVLSPL